jgi:hypothetical protein
MPITHLHPRPWRRGSTFGPGRRVPLDREQRAVWKARLLRSGGIWVERSSGYRRFESYCPSSTALGRVGC